MSSFKEQINGPRSLIMAIPHGNWTCGAPLCANMKKMVNNGGEEEKRATTTGVVFSLLELCLLANTLLPRYPLSASHECCCSHEVKIIITGKKSDGHMAISESLGTDYIFSGGHIGFMSDGIVIQLQHRITLK